MSNPLRQDWGVMHEKKMRDAGCERAEGHAEAWTPNAGHGTGKPSGPAVWKTALRGRVEDEGIEIESLSAYGAKKMKAKIRLNQLKSG